MTTRVLLADDHVVLREGVAALIDAQPDLQVVGQAADADAAVDMFREFGPDVTVMDLSMPGDGLTAIERITQLERSARILALTMHDDPSYLGRVMAAGGTGYLVKTAAPEELVGALREMAAGRTFVRMTAGESGLRPATVPPPEQVGDIRLSLREREVLVLLARGLTNREIAERLGIRKKTVDTYRVRVQDKLGLTTRAELFDYADTHGLLRRPSA